MKIPPLLLLASTLVFPLLCTKSSTNQSTSGASINTVPAVEGFIVKPSSVQQTVPVSGSIRSFEETVLTPDVTGRVVAINMAEGKLVKKGTLLVKLFDDDLLASLGKSKAEFDIANQTLRRDSAVLLVNGLSQSDYDQARLQVNSIKADIEVLEVQIRKTEVRAPFDGVLGLRNISVGAEVTPNTPLATIRAEQQLKLNFSVPEKYSGQIRTGMKVHFTVQGDDTQHEATVIASEEGIDVVTRNLNVRAIVTNSDARIKPGAFANVALELTDIHDALMVPTQAIIPQERNKQVIVSRGGKATFITVQTGIRQFASIQVLAGVSPGDTVVTTGILFLRPGAVVRFSKIGS